MFFIKSRKFSALVSINPVFLAFSLFCPSGAHIRGMMHVLLNLSLGFSFTLSLFASSWASSSDPSAVSAPSHQQCNSLLSFSFQWLYVSFLEVLVHIYFFNGIRLFALSFKCSFMSLIIFNLFIVCLIVLLTEVPGKLPPTISWLWWIVPMYVL